VLLSDDLVLFRLLVQSLLSSSYEPLDKGDIRDPDPAYDEDTLDSTVTATSLTSTLVLFTVLFVGVTAPLSLV